MKRRGDMARVIGKAIPGTHRTSCPKCKAEIEFTNDDIVHNDWGVEIICPNCDEWIYVG